MSALSALYGGVTRLRRSWYERHPASRRRLARPVVSVGNLAVGGSGKTPVVAAIARLLLDMGERPAVLSRGYARRRATEAVVVVSDGARVLVPVEEAGDEPLMLGRALPHVPVLVSRDRYRAGLVAEERFGATVMLLDDGFQHLQLERTVDLLLAGVQDLDDRVLPSGRLREPLSAARAADALLVYGAAGDAERISAALGVAPAFVVRAAYHPVRSIGSGTSIASGARALAVAGIARPERFFSALRQQGIDVAREVSFRDHHWYTSADLSRIGALARDAGAQVVVTTEKDAARLEALVPPGDGPSWAVLPMNVTIEPAAAFRTWLRERL